MSCLAQVIIKINGGAIQASRSLLRLRYLLLFVVALVATASAQTVTGVVPYSSYASHEYDTFNLSNMNLMVMAPVYSKNGPIPFSARLENNNSSNLSWFFSNFTLQVAGMGYASYAHSRPHCPFPDEDIVTDKYFNFYYRDETGAVHNFPAMGWDTQDCRSGDVGTDQILRDGSGLWGHATRNTDGTIDRFYITTVSGRTIEGGLTDSNGNTLSRSADLNGDIVYTDSMQQDVLKMHISGSAQRTYAYTDASNTSQTISVNNTLFTQQTNFGCSFGETNLQAYLPTSISYPDGTSLGIGYEHASGTTTGSVTGRISSITLRTGGTIAFAYSGPNNGINCLDGSTATVTRTENGKTTTFVHTVTDETVNGSGFHTYANQTVIALPDGGTEV